MEGMNWRKSTYSGANGGNCIEAGNVGSAVAVRDSKHPDGPVLAFGPAVWRAFTIKVKADAR
jgi:hypothetical protein